jgi:hypothetical protein
VKGGFYMATVAFQVVFYLLAAACAVLRRPMCVLDVPLTFRMMNWAAVVGPYRFVTGTQDVRWQKADVGP